MAIIMFCATCKEAIGGKCACYDPHTKEIHVTQPTEIDITPTWSGLLPIMLEVMQNPKADPKVKRELAEEFKKMAKLADNWNAFMGRTEKLGFRGAGAQQLTQD